ncbi:hypothetical protein ACFL6P_07195 [Candidatus Latescibacterota bacterium]
MRKGKKQLSFGISTPQEFFTKLKQEQQSLDEDLTSSRYAINAAMTAWHLREWVWGLAVKKNMEVKKKLGKYSKTRKTFYNYLLAQCPELETMQCICEGAKHLGTKGTSVDNTSVHGGAFNNNSFSKAFDISRLQIEKDDKTKEKDDKTKVYFDNELKNVIDFWEQFFIDYLS